MSQHYDVSTLCTHSPKDDLKYVNCHVKFLPCSRREMNEIEPPYQSSTLKKIRYLFIRKIILFDLEKITFAEHRTCVSR